MKIHFQGKAQNLSISMSKTMQISIFILQQYCALVIGDGMNESRLLESEAMII